MSNESNDGRGRTEANSDSTGDGGIPTTRRRFVTTAAVGAVAAAGIPTVAGGPVGHDETEVLTSSVDSLTEKVAPYFVYEQGCNSYPAIDEAGNPGGGLEASGAPDGECSEGGNEQTYTRFTHLNNRNAGRNMTLRRGGRGFAIMYAQYFPKDQGNRGAITGPAGGHRHDWEEVVVFLDGNGNPIKAAASAHGSYATTTPDTAKYWSGDRMQITYGITSDGEGGVFKNNSFGFSSEAGKGDIAMADWNDMNKAQRDGIRDGPDGEGWGDASPKIVDGVFQNKVQEAWDS